MVLGRVTGLYGIRGWVRIHSYTEPREALLEYDGWMLRVGKAWQAMPVAEGRRHGKSIVARFQDVDDRDAAARFLGADIAVPRQALPEAGAGRYYWADLVGLDVRHRDGRSLGTLANMLATGDHDVMVVNAPSDRANEQGREILIPFVMDRTVLQVDLAAGVIEVDWEWD